MSKLALEKLTQSEDKARAGEAHDGQAHAESEGGQGPDDGVVDLNREGLSLWTKRY